ncbi:MAG: DUF2029 domain-containing protein [Hamadaea sp.]|nr:DUF2029 domain-containing protein [Hamadaea sp.]
MIDDAYMLDDVGGPGRTAPRWLLVPGVAVFTVSLAALLLTTYSLGFAPYDLGVYLMGADAWRDGIPVYDEAITSRWGIGYFTYPPVTLVFFAALGALTPGAAHAVMMVLGVAAVVTVIWRVATAFGCASGPGLVGLVLAATGGALWLEPVYDSLQQGQINLILMLLVVADLTAKSRNRAAGIGIGIAAAAKITPAVFVVYLLVTRRFRMAATACATWLALTALGFAVAPADSRRFWLAGTFVDSARVAMPLTPDSVYNQSIHGAAIRFFGSGWGGAGWGDALWLPLAVVVGVAGLWTAVAVSRAHGLLAGGLVTAVTGLLVSPLTWHEHWVWIVPVAVGLAVLAWPHRHRAPFAATVIPLAAVLPFLMWPLPYNAEGDLGPASLLSPAHHLWEDEGVVNPIVGLATAAYPLVGIALVTLAAVATARRPAARAEEPR